MVATHPHAGATYRILTNEDGFGVEVTIPDTYPTKISGFATEAAAAEWIETHKTGVEAEGSAKRFTRRGPKRRPNDSPALAKEQPDGA